MLLLSSGDELKGIDTEEGCCIISDKHLGHLLLTSSGILKPLANLLIFDETIFLPFLFFARLELPLSWILFVLFLLSLINNM
jgi:hypothetical protein